jgi:hypothetical protein
MDQDTRYGLNTSTTTGSPGVVTVSSTLGGEFRIDGRYVRLIAYTGGAGNVPAGDTVISQGSASGKLIGVWSSLTAAPTASGAAMPASGFIKIRAWNSTEYAAGALTGISATASGASTVGWIDIAADQSATFTIPRLGAFNAYGAYYSLGTTNGVANQTFQAPTSGAAVYIPGVLIEKSVGSGTYEWYANAASQTAVAADIRAKVVWITTAGVVRLGHNGTANAGYTPVTGLKVVIPNVYMHENTTAARGTNAAPNVTAGTRPEFLTTGGGVIYCDKVSSNWYFNCSQAYSVNFTNSSFSDIMVMSEIAAPMTWTTVCIGQSAANAQVALAMSLCFAGGTFTDCVFTRATLAASTAYICTFTDIDGFTFDNCRWYGLTVKTNAGSRAINATRMSNFTFTTPKFTNGNVSLITCSNGTVTSISYADVITGTTATTAAQNANLIEVSSNSQNITISGYDFYGLTNVQPYLSLLYLNTAGCYNIKLRNIGTSPSSKLSLGSANQTAYIVNAATGSAANTLKFQRIYVSNTRTGSINMDNSNKNVLIESVFGDDADTETCSALNTTVRSIGGIANVGTVTARYGYSWWNCFNDNTGYFGRLGIAMNETTAQNTAEVSFTGGNPKFTAAGGLYMPTVGDQVVFETQYYILGHTKGNGGALQMGGGTIGNYTWEYQLDKNDGNGYSAWATFTASAWSAVTGIDASKGFKMKWRITTTTTNTTAITYLYTGTVTGATAIAYTYPLDQVTLALTGLQAGSEVRCYTGTDPATCVEIGGIESSGTTLSFLHASGGVAGFIRIMATGYQEYYLPITYSSVDQSIPISQVLDRNYQP